MSEAVLEVLGLTVGFGAEGARLRAVHGLDLSVGRGEVVALVGESGSGKSATALALARLNEGPGAEIGGAVRLGGADVLSLGPAELRRLRGRGVAMVFQDATAALNPCETIGDQIAEALAVHGTGRRAARARAVELLDEVGLPEPARRARLYPHEVSGGQRQRAMIALALACDPDLLVADEPTTALDVTVQAQVLALLRDAVRRRGMGMVLITHDLGVVAGVADRVLVIYAGRVVEAAPVEALFAAPAHPYAAGLMAAAGAARGPDGRLMAIPGAPPALGDDGDACAYAPRCPRAAARCRSERPALSGEGRAVACHFPLAPGEHP